MIVSAGHGESPFTHQSTGAQLAHQARQSRVDSILVLVPRGPSPAQFARCETTFVNSRISTSSTSASGCPLSDLWSFHARIWVSALREPDAPANVRLVPIPLKAVMGVVALALALVTVFAVRRVARASAGVVSPVCVAAELRATVGLQGATGSQLGGVSVTNASRHTCALPATPQVSLIWHGRRLAVRQVAFPAGWLRAEYPHGSTRVRVLKPRQTAFVVLQWWTWCGPRPWGRGYFKGFVKLRLPGQQSSVMARLREVAAPYCNSPPSTLRVSPFLPPS